ncbi:Stress responsive A/B barrel domain protein [Quillaja saponaria]|uniref:Stress responsive A/B barrel domain protein n=1 Tax=Quillaja saponaria TaxID=32244 RepID=A0AAD7LDH4_QUISA|nr:Stress responsive A/B barrel domain protein [Quillaja saponaria]
MGESKGVMKHVVLVKFKDKIPPDQIEQLIKEFANLVNLIPSMKSFHWGKDESSENMHQGFTHVFESTFEDTQGVAEGKDVRAENMHEGFTHAFESTFESTEGVAEYVAHTAHVEYANRLLPNLEKVIVFDYMPTTVRA